MESKPAFRLAIVERLKHLGQRDREVESQVLCRNLKKNLGDEPGTVAAFLPYLDEPDIKPLLTDLLEHGWTVVMPAVQSNRLIFRTIASLSDVGRNPITRINEPSSENPAADESLIDVAIIPGRAFTKTGERMGRGNGGYDHWIRRQRTRQPKTRFIGVCFECQLVPEVPMEEHDQKVDVVITSREIHMMHDKKIFNF